MLADYAAALIDQNYPQGPLNLFGSMTCTADVTGAPVWLTDCPMCGAAGWRQRNGRLLRGRKMTSSSQTEEIASNRCHNCNRHSAAPENFCRWCGFHQREGPVAAGSADWRKHTTTILAHNEEVPRSLSSLPLNTLAQSVAVKTGSLRLNRYAALVIAVLIAIPMWLLIILLSPFDAYVSAKAAWSQMEIR